MSITFLHSDQGMQGSNWTSAIADELESIELTIRSVINSSVEVASDLSGRLLASGGKRIRPSLLTLSALTCGECDRERMTYLAAATELVHMASLVHDDVIDETRERRGSATAGAQFGNKISVLGGDYLLSKAFHLLCVHGNPDILKSLSATAVVMVESEILQASGEGDLSLWESEYWRIIRGKTADFMASCCECGAMLADADVNQCQAMREYGLQLGLAFQITDDVLDIAGNSELTGKETGADLINGKFTLPVLMALRDADGDGSLRKTLSKGHISACEAEKITAIIIESGALETANSAAADCVEAAIKQLSIFPQSIYTDALQSLAEFVISRNG